MSSRPPNGFFAEDMILFGALHKGGTAAKGFILQPPDLRGASVAALNGYQDKVRGLLANLGERTRAQFQWTCSSDYRQELTRYFRETERIVHPHIKQARTERFERYWAMMQRRELRREQLVLFLATEVATAGVPLGSTAAIAGFYEKVIGQLKTQFDELGGTLRTIFGADTAVTPMDDLDHFTYCSKFLNPSLAERFDHDFSGQFNPELSLQENCWNSDGVGIENVGFYLDGRYHTIFTLKRWPSRTYPGIMHRLTGLPFLD